MISVNGLPTDEYKDASEWSLAPEWAQYATICSEGICMWHEELPTRVAEDFMGTKVVYWESKGKTQHINPAFSMSFSNRITYESPFKKPTQ